MPAKKARKPSRSLRYLLYADRRFKRISVRRLSERLKKARQAQRTMRRKRSAAAVKSSRRPFWMPTSRAMAVGATCVVAAVALVTAGQPDGSDVVREEAVREEALDLGTRYEVAPRRVETRRSAVSQASIAPAAVKPRAPRPVEQLAVRPVEPAAPRAVDVPRQKPVEPPMPRAQESKADAPVPAAAAPADTDTGCLDQDDNTFWLKNTTGTEAPKSRSWRSGFLKRSSSSVEVVDAANTLRLSSYVGQRVAATGMLNNREIQARSLKRVAASCS